MVRTPGFHCQKVPGSIPGWGTNIPKALRRSKKKKDRDESALWRGRYVGWPGMRGTDEMVLAKQKVLCQGVAS